MDTESTSIEMIGQLKLSTAAIDRMSGAINSLNNVMVNHGKILNDMLNVQTEALKDSKRKADAVEVSASRAPGGQENRLASGAKLVDSISSASPVLGGMGVGLGALGVGIGGFFLGLAGAEAVMNQFGSGENLKKLIVNLGDALESLDPKSMMALGALLTGSALFAANTSLGTQFKVATGMTAIGAGIGGFFAGLSAGDAAASWMNTDMSKMKAMMINLADGLSAFSSRDLGSLGALLTSSALFAANTSLGGQFKVATGMTLIGAGIGGFFAGLTGATDIAAFLGADGSGIKNMMINLADGLAAFSSRDLGALGAMLGVGGLFGAVPGGLAIAGGAALGMTAIGAGIAGFLGAFAGVGDIAAYFGADGSGIKTMMINIGEGLSAFNTVDGGKVLSAAAAMTALSPALILFFGAQGISSVLDGITKFVTWVSGGDDPITTVVNQLRKFEEVNFDKLRGAEGLSIGATLTDISNGLMAFSEASFDSAVLNTLTSVLNWFGGNSDPFESIAKIGDQAGSINAAADAIEKIAKAMTKFAEVPAATEFDFSKMAEQLVATVPLLDAVLHGGEIDDWGLNTVIEKGLLSKDFELDAGIDAINKVKAALAAMYNMNTDIDLSAVENASASATPAGASAVEAAATERAQREATNVGITNAPSTVINGGSTSSVNHNTTIIRGGQHESLNAFMPI
jgi:hypothetical protein